MPLTHLSSRLRAGPRPQTRNSRRIRRNMHQWSARERDPHHVRVPTNRQSPVANQHRQLQAQNRDKMEAGRSRHTEPQSQAVIIKARLRILRRETPVRPPRNRRHLRNMDYPQAQRGTQLRIRSIHHPIMGVRSQEGLSQVLRT